MSYSYSTLVTQDSLPQPVDAPSSTAASTITSTRLWNQMKVAPKVCIAVQVSSSDEPPKSVYEGKFKFEYNNAVTLVQCKLSLTSEYCVSMLSTAMQSTA